MRGDLARWLACGLALLLSAPCWADWKRDYALGERAIRDGDFARAEALFRSAARDEPTPDDRKRFEGVVFRDYAPQFWAGFAAWRQGACDRAIDYWQDSANNAATLSRIKDFKAQQDRGLADCRQKLAQTTAAAPPVVAQTPPVASTPQVPAQKPPATAPAPVVTSPPVAQQPTTQQPTAQQPPRPPVATPTPKPAPTAPAETARTAPAALTKAVDAWIGGRYSDVIAASADGVADGRARAHVHLLRAAARHMESELGNTASVPLAQEEVRAARRALASISPDPTLFSPRFRTFWQQTR